MSQLSSPQPPAPQTPVAAMLPQSSAPDLTMRAGNQANATSFVDQLAKLLETLAQTEQAVAATAPPAAAGDQSATPATAVSTPPEADATNSLIAAISGTSAAQAQIGSLAAATTPQVSDAGSVRLRDGGNNKPKAELATPARRNNAASSQRATIPDPVVPPAPDSPVALPVPPPAVSDLDVRHNGAPHRTSDEVDAGGVAGTPPSPAAVGQKAEEPSQAAAEPQEPTPIRLTPAELTTNALPSPPPAALSQPTAPPPHTMETSAAAPHGQPTSPAAQITPALMQVGHASDGTQQPDGAARPTGAGPRAGKD